MLKLWTIYDKPLDYPLLYVARQFEMMKATDRVILSPTLEGLQEYMKGEGLTRIPRDETDDRCIVEVWI